MVKLRPGKDIDIRRKAELTRHEACRIGEDLTLRPQRAEQRPGERQHHVQQDQPIDRETEKALQHMGEPGGCGHCRDLRR